jgi:hypothetical protein
MVADLLTDFDLPDCAFVTPKRSSTTSPLQALTLLNHQFTLDLAAALATRVGNTTAESDWKEKVSRAFELALLRGPDDFELNAAEKLVQDHGLAALCRALLNANELLHLE